MAIRIPRAVPLFAVSTLAFLAFPGAVAAEPEITETNVENGDVLDSAPEAFNLCFSESVISADIDPETSEDDRPWRFTVSPPDGIPLGLRIVFESDGDCVDVFPGLPEEPPEGIWTFEWMVRSQETNEPATGVITFRVGPGNPPLGTNDTGGGDISTSLIVAVVAGVIGAIVVTGAAFAVMQRRAASHTRK